MQQVNLHQPPSGRIAGRVSANSAGAALLIIAVALLCIWGFAWWQLQGMRHLAADARAQRNAQQALEAARNAELDALEPEALDQRIVALESAVAMKTQAAQILRSETQHSAAFSERLAALSRRHLDGVWLEQLTLGAERDAMSLIGAALSPDLVPQYLQSLAADPALRGGQIDNFVIDRPSLEAKRRAPHLRFRAATRALQTPASEPEES
jgi:hypothetical protein